MAQKYNKIKYKIIFLILIGIEIVWLLGLLIHSGNLALLNPKGIIATQQRNLLLVSVGLMMLVVIPVFATTFFIAWKYRENNNRPKRDFDEHAHSNHSMVWWAIPTLLVMILAPLTWKTAHDLDPLKALVSSKKPITIQVVALQWKWLFIYPEQNIATINFIQFPENTPINFELTADAPMNSFWIPQLGGQMYAMPAMSTKLHLMATEIGEFNGSAAEISGAGFAGMKFTARSSTQKDFDQWVLSVQQGLNAHNSENDLTLNEYNLLALTSENNPQTFYPSVKQNLFDSVIQKYLPPGGGHGH